MRMHHTVSNAPNPWPLPLNPSPAVHAYVCTQPYLEAQLAGGGGEGGPSPLSRAALAEGLLGYVDALGDLVADNPK